MCLRKYIQLRRGSWRTHVTWTQSLKSESCIHSPTSTLQSTSQLERSEWILWRSARYSCFSLKKFKCTLEEGKREDWEIPLSFTTSSTYLAPSRNFRSTQSAQVKHISDICSAPAFSSSFFILFCSSFSGKSGTVVGNKCRGSPQARPVSFTVILRSYWAAQHLHLCAYFS